MKKRQVLALMVVVCFVFTGCWNYREIDSLSIMAGVGIERDAGNGDFVLYLEIVQPSGKSKEQSSESRIIESRGKTVIDAVRNAIKISGKRLFWSHAQIVVISEEVARQGIFDVIDCFYRDAESRLTLRLMVAKDASVKEILTVKGITDEIRSFEIYEALKNQRSIEKYPAVELYQTVEMLKSDVPYTYMPSITMKKQEGSDVTDISGTAVFKGDRLKGFLDLEDTKYFLYVTDQIKGGLLVKEDIQGKPDNNLCLEVFENKTTVKPVYSNGEITMKIHTETEAAIAESGPEVNFENDAGLTALKEEMQESLQKNMLRVIQKVQKEFDCDIFGFGESLDREMPGVWEEYKDDWDTGFQELKFDVSSEIEIRNSATAMKALNGVE